MDTYKLLKHHPRTQATIPHLWYLDRWNYVYGLPPWLEMGFSRKREFDLYRTGLKNKRKIISGFNDYLRVDDFYSKLDERNKYLREISDKGYIIDEIALRKLNKECLELGEDALKNVNWSKYK